MWSKYSLKSKKAITELFKTGASVKSFPLKLIAHPNPENVCKIGFSIPKRQVKKAVHRNKIKRQLKSLTQQHQNDLFQKLPNHNIFFIYMGRENPDFSVLENAFMKVISKL